MKKSMIVLLVTLFTLVTQAGVAKWGVSNINKSGVKFGGAYGYVFEAASVPAGLADTIAAGNFAGGAKASYGPANTSGAILFTLTPTLGTYASTTATFYLVLFDSSSTTSGQFTILAPISQSFGATGDKTFAFNATSATWTTIVPEPTSMALLAIGGAVFGLRRKFRK